jgi:hypothetical protein
MCETPEESDFTSIQERLKAYVQQQKSSKEKQLSSIEPTKRYPFVKSKSNESLNGIDFNEEDYFWLVDWTGRAIHDDKRGSIPIELSPIIERLKLNPNTSWLSSIKH